MNIVVHEVKVDIHDMHVCDEEHVVRRSTTVVGVEWRERSGRREERWAVGGGARGGRLLRQGPVACGGLLLQGEGRRDGHCLRELHGSTDLGKLHYTKVVDNFDTFLASINNLLYDKRFRSNDL
jgi:hypothetical protein